MNDLRPQLAPGWSGVNIALLVVLFFVTGPFALVMLAYILFGDRLGLHLGHPETFVALWQRFAGAWRAGASGNSGVSGTGGTPDPVLQRERDLETKTRELEAEREALARERTAFEQERVRRNDADA